MRAAFLLAILVLSAFYTYTAFADLAYLSSAGRLGPGFFPRVIGVGLIALSLYCLVADTRRAGPEAEVSPYWRVAATIGVLSAIFVALLHVLGGLLSMIVFMLASLWFLNRDRPVQNGLIALILPLAIFVMFDYWLNASMPPGLISLPI